MANSQLSCKGRSQGGVVTVDDASNQLEIISDSTANSVSLLISILVRYPEIATVNFVPEGKILKFTFMTSSSISDQLWNAFCQKLFESVEVYASLVHRGTPRIKAERLSYDCVSIVEISRDVATLTQEEISLIIELARHALGSELITEVSSNDDEFEEELVYQDEMIETMLDDLRESVQQRKLIGFREEGRVLVFNKQTERTKP
ncbi:MAG TPA: hypothetical protein PLH34_05540 [Bacillota bacterium]|nr:hypothetical protein [Bacillota bacterium]